jgi:hypothetical protein
MSAMDSENMPKGTKYAIAPGPSWVMNDDPAHDPRASNPEASGNMPNFSKASDGDGWNIAGNTGHPSRQEVRWAIMSYSGKWINPNTCYPKVKADGFMTPGVENWLNIEMGAKYRIRKLGNCNSDAPNGRCHIEHVMRGQRSTSDQGKSADGCGISCADNYHCNLYPHTGDYHLEKDLDHQTHYAKNNEKAEKKGLPEWPVNQWVDVRTVCYNKGAGVMLEIWVDIGDGKGLQMVTSHLDNNDWPVNQASTVKQDCNVDGTPAITWGGPLSVFRSDNIESYDIKDAYIATIAPPS